MKSQISKIIRQSINFLRCIALRLKGVDIARDCQVSMGVRCERGVHHSQSGRISIGPSVKLCEGVLMNSWGGSINIDENVFIGPYSIIYGHGGVEIGKNTLIAEHCSIHSANHTIPSKQHCIRHQADKRVRTTIGEDVWLGAGVRVLAGVRIGKGCIVGAGAVVTKDLAPYSIAVGVPASVIGERSDSEEDDNSEVTPQ